LKQNNLLSPFIWSLITSGRTPLNNLLGLQEAFIYHRPSPVVAAGLESFPFDLVVPFLLTILVITNRFTRVRSEAKDWGKEASL
jgi:hypothetical protein